MSDSLSVRPSPWRVIAQMSGLTHASDLPLILWPMLWAALLAKGGLPAPWHLAALIIAVALARSAAWIAFAPNAVRVRQIPRERHLLILLFASGALCFALPLGWAGALVPASLALLALWFPMRRRSYLSDPLLALAVALLTVAAWLSQGGSPTKAGGLLFLASLFWILAALITHPVERSGASLSALAAPHQRTVVLLLEIVALVALGATGWQSHLGVWFGLGVAVATVISFYLFWSAEGRPSYFSAAIRACWGGAIFLGATLHLLLDSAATS